jgi:type III pantothenate kinase
LGATLASLLALRQLDFGALEASVVSSTVPELGPQWEEVAANYLGHAMLVVNPSIKTEIAIRIDDPEELGADRLVNAIAAYERLQGSGIVVDFGTATTFDVVSEAGDYLGGLIAPGVEISIDALARRAAKLPKVDLMTPRSIIGKSTAEAIRAGVIYGFSAQVDGIVKQIRRELAAQIPALATGGAACSIVPYCQTIDDVDDFLTLRGLQLIHERNS